MTFGAIAEAVRAACFGFVRDPGSVAIAFCLPPVIFLVFASIFVDLSGGAMRVRAIVADDAGTPTTMRLLEALNSQSLLRVSTTSGAERVAEARARVRRGAADVAIVLRADLRPDASRAAPPIAIFSLPERSAAATIAAGQIQRALVEGLPDVTMLRIFHGLERAGSISTEQREFLEDETSSKAAPGSAGGSLSLAGLVEIDTGGGSVSPPSPVAISTGALAILFLMVAALQNAFALIEERESGLHERIASGGSYALAAIVIGRFVLLIAIGIVQAILVFATARIVHGVDIMPSVGSWFATTVLAASAAAGIAVAIASGSRTIAQAHMLGTFLVLLSGAVGGSMVPRYLMPEWLRSFGWLTPNAWAIEAYSAALRGDTVWGLLLPLASFAAIGLAASILLSKQSLRRH